MVDELVRAAWGRTYIQKSILRTTNIKCSTQMLAKKGNPGSSVINADEVMQPGTEALYKCRATWLTPRTWSCRLRKHELPSRSTLDVLLR